MKNYKESILKELNSTKEKAIALKNTRDTELQRAEKTYRGQALKDIRTSIEDNYTNGINELTSTTASYLNKVNTELRKQVSAIATKSLTDNEITDMEFIKAYGIKKMQDNPILFNMYLEKHAHSFPFRALLVSEGVNMDNVSIPITEIDNIFMACDRYLTNIRTTPEYASSLDSAVLLSDNHGSIGMNCTTVDTFINAYSDQRGAHTPP